MAFPRLAPIKSVRYRWTQRDTDLVKRHATGDHSLANTLTPYGLAPHEGRMVKDAATNAERKLSELKDGDTALVPLEYSNSWYPLRAIRYFDSAYDWEPIPGGVTGKTIGDLFDALVKWNIARYGHYDRARGNAAEEAWKVLEHWGNTDFRWAYLKANKVTTNTDPLALPTEVKDPNDASKLLRIGWVAFALPRTVQVVAAPTRPGAVAPEKKTATITARVSLDKDSWSFMIVKDTLVAVAHGQAIYADLADGSRGKGTAKAGTRVDVTGLFPAWVKEALSAQVKTGALIVQADPRDEPTGFSGMEHDLGQGNCHGFTSKVFQLFNQETFAIWKPDGEHETSTRPAGAPLKMLDVLPRYQYVGMALGKQAGNAITKSARWYDNKTKYPGQWTGWIDLGRNVFVEKIVGVGASSVQTPRFGDLGIAAAKSKGFRDHSLIGLGHAAASVGGAEPRIYCLQKMSPLNPYAVMAHRVSDYDWYRFPKGPGQSGGATR